MALTSDNLDSNLTTAMNINSIIEFKIGQISPFLVVFICIVFAMMMIVSIVGNGLTCLVIKRSRRLQSTTNYFIFALAVTGLIISLTIPFLIASTVAGSWIFPNWFCRGICVLITTFLGSDLFLLVGIALDRYYTIIYPLSFKITLNRSYRIISFSSLVSGLIALPCAYFYSKEPIVPMLNENRMRCYVPYGSLKWRLAPAFFTPLICVQYLVPVLILILTYWRVTCFIWTFTKGIGSRIGQRTENHVPRAKVKTLKVILIISAVVIIVNGLVQILRCIDLVLHNVDSIDLLWIAFALIQISPVTKPIICLLCNTSFRRGCREVLCWSRLHCYREELYAVTTVSSIAKHNHVACLPPAMLMSTMATNNDTERRVKGQLSGDTDSDDSGRYCLRKSDVIVDRSNLIGNNWTVQNNNTFI